jgi:phenylalanine-4-hydroxylase
MINPAVNRLPNHLKKYIVPQNYEDYTSIDHAVWRYIMRQSFNFLSIHAHISYVDGLKKTGICINRIPNIDEMNEILTKIGWGAVCVDGFIPPNAFMEFQAYNVLVIAADIRHINHIQYTPAPDIVHEAAGHAPIIANPEYAEYLRLFGEIGSKALSSKKDNDLYEAIRKLSILKENPFSTVNEILAAETEVIDIQNNMGELSEMAKIRNLHWWTVEYGLIGSIDNPQIYGAGLLSSLGESLACLDPKIKKLPYDLNTINYSFDITTQQPQLFVTPNFSHLTMVLNRFADTMALRQGGVDGVLKAIDSEAFATVELDSGLQISGIFTDVFLDDNGEICFLKTNGPTILCENEHLLIGHGREYHNMGYSTPIGLVVGFEKPLQEYRLNELASLGYIAGQQCEMNFKSGISVKGMIHSFRKNKFGKTLLISFSDCTVTFGEKILFLPEWGIFDMAVGVKVVSVFAGSADKNEIDPNGYISPTNTVRLNKHDAQLLSHYQKVRELRNSKINDEKKFKEIFNDLVLNFESDWLLSLELLELLERDSILFKEIKKYLDEKSRNIDLNSLIINGLHLI